MGQSHAAEFIILDWAQVRCFITRAGKSNSILHDTMLAWPLCRCVNTMFLHGPMIDAANYAINKLNEAEGHPMGQLIYTASAYKYQNMPWDNIYNKC